MAPKKATAEQLTLLIEMFSECPCLKWGKGTPEEKKEAWTNIGGALNALGGAEKSPEGWKKTFIEMKSHIKGKLRGGKQLNSIEQKCAEVTGLYVSSFGINPIPELGIVDSDNRESRKDIENPEVDIPEGTNEAELDERVSEHEDVEEEKCTKTKSKETQRKVVNSNQLLLKEHIETTNKGLESIAKAIESVAEAINTLAVAVNLKE